MIDTPTACALEALILSVATEGRRIGQEIDADPGRYCAMADFPLSRVFNTLGCPSWVAREPFRLLDGTSVVDLSLVLRCVLYEALGRIDPNLLFAAPGPGMAGFVVNRIGTDTQKRWFFERFGDELTWSFFALTEPQMGSDAGHIATTATAVADGYRLTGQKYLIGNGAIGTVGVVFARTAPGPLGIDAFLIEPRNVDGVVTECLQTTGCRGANLSRLGFQNVFLPHEAQLGAHLKPTERYSLSAAATFDALRPCVGAIALGIARRVLQEAESGGLIRYPSDQGALARARHELDALRQSLHRVCTAYDAGKRLPRAAGHLKSIATNCAEAIVSDVIARSGPGALAAHPWLARAWRDIKAFEYTEGTTHIHSLNAATLFRADSNAAQY